MWQKLENSKAGEQTLNANERRSNAFKYTLDLESLFGENASMKMNAASDKSIYSAGKLRVRF